MTFGNLQSLTVEQRSFADVSEMFRCYIFGVCELIETADGLGIVICHCGDVIVCVCVCVFTFSNSRINKFLTWSS